MDGVSGAGPGVGVGVPVRDRRRGAIREYRGSAPVFDSGDCGPFGRGECVMERGLEGEALELDGVRDLILGETAHQFVVFRCSKYTYHISSPLPTLLFLFWTCLSYLGTLRKMRIIRVSKILEYFENGGDISLLW